MSIMKIASFVFLFLFSIASVTPAEVIDVNIKGVDDGIKTNRQQDYREAVMNAKLQAIERSGASIESITKVVNFQLKYDAIESSSKAILLPGFQIIDIGYLADGTYQVVLVGKIQVGESDKKNKVKEVQKDGWFIAYEDGTVVDTRTHLMWAAKDNGADINWHNAKNYCETYRMGGYKDWRMPTLNELAGLYDANKRRYSGCSSGSTIGVVTELINISCLWSWASETRGTESGGLFFGHGGPGWPRQSATNQLRVLPVRNAK